MALSKKHYEQFAYRFKNKLDDTRVAADSGLISKDAGKVARAYLLSLATSMAVDFALDNPNFDRARFLRACGF